MSFTLRMSGVIVGRSELETRDASRHIASGVFRPGLGYDLVQPVFGLYARAGDAEAIDRYRRTRDALKLQLTDSSGAVVPVRELHIRHDGDTGSPMIEVETDDATFWTTSSAS